MVGRRSVVSAAVTLLALGSGSAALAAPASDAASPTAAGSAVGTASWCTAGARVSVATAGAGFSAAECSAEDLTIVSGAASVRVPARGQAVSIDVLTTRGASQLSVARDAAGNVTLAGDTPQSPTRTASACSSTGYQLIGYRIQGTYTWSYNPAGAPGSVAGAAARTLTAATANITNGRNDCGLRTKPRTSHRYTGTTGAAPGISAAAQCSSNDGRSVSGWKPLTAGGVLAVTCTYYNPATRVVIASDVAINTRFSWSVSAASCRNAYDLKGVMVHERGHTFGLGHSTADTGLTMYPSVRACDFSKSTLGKGDVQGLVRIYGAA